MLKPCHTGKIGHRKPVAERPTSSEVPGQDSNEGAGPRQHALHGPGHPRPQRGRSHSGTWKLTCLERLPTHPGYLGSIFCALRLLSTVLRFILARTNDET